MFTPGIFSSHLPYIAFVLFYGFFFIAGIEKVSAGGFSEDRQVTPKFASMSGDNVFDVIDSDSAYCNPIAMEAEYKQQLLYSKKLWLFYSCNASLNLTDYCISLFSRPPPAARETF